MEIVLLLSTISNLIRFYSLGLSSPMFFVDFMIP
jgi:hypothetical protein